MLSYDQHSDSFSLLSVEDRTKLDELKQKWPVPKCESQRLRVLRETKLIGSVDDVEVYSRYTSLVNRHFKVPIVLISLIDIDRQWFKTKLGVGERTELPRQGALCSRILLEDSPLMIATEDVRRDTRFTGCDLTWVATTPAGAAAAETAAKPTIRFYASVALVVDNMRIGSLSLYDTVPRHDLVEKAVRLLPDFGAIISDAMDRRHKLLLGSGAELAELSVSVMYNLKFPLQSMQRSLRKTGEFAAFQPHQRVTRVPVVPAAEPCAACTAEAPTSSSSAAAAMTAAATAAPQTPGAVAAEKLSQVSDSPEQDGDSEWDGASNKSRSLSASPARAAPVTHAGTVMHGFHSPGAAAVCTHVRGDKIKYKKITNTEVLRAEKDDLLDQLQELRRASQVLIKVLDHSLSLAHALQSQFQRRQSGVFAQEGANIVYNSIPHKKPTADAAQERAYTNQRVSNRLKKMYNCYQKCAANSADLTYAIDPVLIHCQENEHRRYQFNSRAVTLAMYSSLYHISRLHPKARLEVAVRFEERDPVEAQLQRLTSPSNVGSSRHFMSHKLGSPGSNKSAIESGKVTRLPSFNTAGAPHLSTASYDTSMGDHLREGLDMLFNNNSRRPSVEEATPPLAQRGTPESGFGSGTNSNNASAEKKPFPIPSPIHIPAFYASPRTSTTKTQSARSLHSAGDLVLTFRCAVKSSNNHTPTADSNGVAKEMGGVKTACPLAPSVETAIFEKIIIRNIVSTVNGGFSSSTGAEFNADAPTAAGVVGALFNAAGTSSTRDGTNTLPPSLKLHPHETLEEIREDSGSEGEVYTLMVRIPCNIISLIGEASALEVGANSKDSASLSTVSGMPRTPHQMHCAFPAIVFSTATDGTVLKTKPAPLGTGLSTIPSIRSMASASGSSSRLTHGMSSSSSKRTSIADFTAGASSSSMDFVDSGKAKMSHEEGSLRLPLRFKPAAEYLNLRGNAKTSTFQFDDEECQSPSGAEASAKLAVRQKTSPGEETAPFAASQKNKPKPQTGRSIFQRPLGLFTAVSTVTQLLFGRGPHRRRVATNTLHVANSPSQD